MFDIYKLIELFPDINIKRLLVQSYYYSQEKDKNLSNSVFNQLLFLKMRYPSINIVLDTSMEKSNFNPSDKTIYLNRLSIEIFFHELTHLLSYFYSYFQVPSEFKWYSSAFLSLPEKEKLAIKFLDLCQEREDALFKEFQEAFFNEAFKNGNIFNKMGDNSSSIQPDSIEIICLMEDIIDALYSGKPSSSGLVYIKDINTIKNINDIRGTSGHGCDYYQKNDLRYEEIIANYLAIKLTDPNNKLFSILKGILGDDFVTFLEQRCNEISGNIIIDKNFINTSNKIMR